MTQPISIERRLCLGHQLMTALSAVTPASLTVPDGAICATIQPDGGVVRVRLDAGTASATSGIRLDDGVMFSIDSALSSARLLAQSGTTTNVQIAYFDKI